MLSKVRKTLKRDEMLFLLVSCWSRSEYFSFKAIWTSTNFTIRCSIFRKCTPIYYYFKFWIHAISFFNLVLQTVYSSLMPFHFSSLSLSIRSTKSTKAKRVKSKFSNGNFSDIWLNKEWSSTTITNFSNKFFYTSFVFFLNNAITSAISSLLRM